MLTNCLHRHFIQMDALTRSKESRTRDRRGKKINNCLQKARKSITTRKKRHALFCHGIDESNVLAHLQSIQIQIQKAFEINPIPHSLTRSHRPIRAAFRIGAIFRCPSQKKPLEQITYVIFCCISSLFSTFITHFTFTSSEFHYSPRELQ